MAGVCVRTVTIEKEAVRVRIDRLSVSAVDALCELDDPRGPTVDAEAALGRQWDRVLAIDRHIEVEAGDLTVDGVPQSRLAMVVGARADLVEQLYHELLDAQVVSAGEERDLEVATRFSYWLDDARKQKLASKWVETGTSCGRCRQADLCGSRGCDGEPKKRPVWHHAKFVVTTCPVRSFTPDVERALRTFYGTHEQTPEGWRQVTLPSAGGHAEQEAWMVRALSVLRRVHRKLTEQSKAN